MSACGASTTSRPRTSRWSIALRPVHHAHAFAEVQRRFGLEAPTGHKAIDHLLVRGLGVAEAPHALAPAAREVEAPGGLRFRLSDHAPVTGVFSMR